MKKIENKISFQNGLRKSFAVITVWFLGLVVVNAQNNNSTLIIDLLKPGHSISPILYNGMLFEEINYGVDGGFYAQLIKNGSLEDNDLIPMILQSNGSFVDTSLHSLDHAKLNSWSIVSPGSSMGILSTPSADKTSQLNSKQYHCLKLDITSVSSGIVGAANAGFWGIRLDNNTKYMVSFFAKKDSDFTGTITVKLESNNGKVYAISSPFTPTTNWQKFTCDLITNGIANVTGENRFVLYGSTIGSLYFDVVRVMPPTYKNRPNGLRIDMAEMQAALHPKLIRFPGGCDVEHTNVDSGWNWKNAIGPIEQRPGMIDQSWGYHNSQQFGLDELFQMCEDWGAEPIYCTSMSSDDGKITTTMGQMQPFVQDVLDLIEYANGDAKITKWGKIRAANGHSAPYNLKYIEIGNENGNEKEYHERYSLFYNSIKQAYPNMNVIINTKLNGQKADLIDEHFGVRPSTYFDNYERTGPKIVVGEYGDKESNTEEGNLNYAIKEAVFLTGIERNSDKVICTTFSTLSANVNFINWFPDLYYNNSVTFFAIPSYYMEKMFVENTGDVVLPYSLKGTLFVAPSRANENGDVIIKVVNASDSISNSLITINGASKTKNARVLVTLLTSESISDKNSLAQPHKVIPLTSSFDTRGNSFNYHFPAHSISILRLVY